MLEKTTTPDGRVITKQARGSRAGQSGRFQKNPESLARFREALALYEQGHTYPEIGAIMKLPAKRPDSAARYYVQQAIKLWPGAQEDADAWRAKINADLDDAQRKALHLWNNPGSAYAAGSGKVILGPDGNPEPNRQHQLAALEKLLKIAAQRARLNGADVAVESKATLRVTTEHDAEIGRIAAAMIEAGHAEDVARWVVESIGATAPRSIVTGALEPAPERQPGNAP